MTPEQKTLVELAQMIADRDIAEAGARSGDVHRLANKIGELRMVAMLQPSEATAKLQVMGNAWGEWRRREIASLNLNLAKATLLEEGAKQKARRALGRRLALESIFKEKR